MDSSATARTPLAEVSGLNVRFVSRDATVHAVNGIDFAVHDGEVLCILGESGSGKSVSLRALLRLLPRHARIEGSVRVAGEEVLSMPARALRNLRGGKVAMIFQEPMTALDPVYTVRHQIGEAVRRHAPAHSNSSSWCASPRPSAGSTPIHTSCRAACASAR